jgi:hypothetical protein
VLDLLDQVEQNLTVNRTSIVEFAESDQFCNKPLYPRQRVLLKLMFLEPLEGWEEDILDFWIAGGRGGSEIEISPDIRRRVEYLRERGYQHFREVDLVGGRRSSKGFTTGIAMAKVMWETLQLQDPGSYYGIDSDKEIFFSCIAGSEAQAKEFQYADFSQTVAGCKAFEPYIVRDLETEIRIATSVDLRKIQQSKSRGSKAGKDIARLRGKALAANAGTLRGSATMVYCIDEMAHMIPGESKASADQVYGAADPSLDQFGKDGMAFCNSSPWSKVGMFYERYVEAMKSYNPDHEPSAQINPTTENGNPLIMAFQFPSWALFEGYDKDPQRRFRKAITVSPDWNADDPEFEYLSEEDRTGIAIARSKEAANPETYKVERRGKFAEVTDAYLNPTMVDRAFMGMPVGYNDQGQAMLKPFNTNWGEGALNIHKYKFHLDPSSTTAGFGFAIAHLERIEDKAGNLAPHVVFDIIKRWNPKDFPGHTIQWPVVINEVLGHADIFRPYEITMDQFQSAEPIQTLQYALLERGIEGINVYKKEATLEENWFRWETFKTALNHGLVHAPCDTEDLQLASNELKFLQVKNTGGRYPRVDKQDIGPVQTKDMADCVAECTQALIGNLIANQMRDRAVSAVMAPGAQGGFQIGGKQQPSLSELHPNLAGYYEGLQRAGEQRLPATQAAIPNRMAIGGGRRGMNRGAGRRSRSRF